MIPIVALRRKAFRRTCIYIGSSFAVIFKDHDHESFFASNSMTRAFIVTKTISAANYRFNYLEIWQMADVYAVSQFR